MNIIRKYFLKRFLYTFLIITLGLSLVISLLDLIDRIDELEGLTLGLLILYPVYMMPKYFSYIMPIAGLFSALFTMGQAGKAKEIVAIIAAGGRLKRLLVPFVFTGILFSIVGFLFNESLVPYSTKKAKELKRPSLSKKYKTVSKEGTLWVRAVDGSIVRIELYIPDKNISKGISIIRFKDGKVDERIEAVEAEFDKDVWILKNLIVYDITDGTLRRLDSMKFHSLESPKFLNREVESPDDMGIIELRKYVKKLNLAGFKNIRLEVDMHSRLSYPLINFFMVILGASISLRKEHGGLISGGIGLGVTLIYWIGFTLASSFGYTGILPPAVSAWILPVVFCGVSVYLFKSIKE